MSIGRDFILTSRGPGESFEDWVTRSLEEMTRVSQEEGVLAPLNIDPDTLADGDTLSWDATNQFWTVSTAVSLPTSLPPPDGDKGDITVTSSGTAWTIDSDVVTNAKLANMATASFKGRTAAGTGDPEDLTVAEATALLNAMVGDSGSGGTKGLVPAPATGDADKALLGDGDFHLAEDIDATKSLSGSGYCYLPGGLLVQWGEISVTQDTAQAFNFPTTFPTACAVVLAGLGPTYNTNAVNWAITAKSTTGFSIDRNDSFDSTTVFYYIALGY